MKICSKCGEEKDISEFRARPNTRHKLGVNPSCKVCEALYTAKWRESNPGAATAYSRKWRKENPDKNAQQEARRRAKKRNQTPQLSPTEQQRIDELYWLARDLRAVSGEEYHVDHIVPLAKGGLHRPDNLQVLPADLNIRKSDKYDPRGNQKPS